MDYSTCIECFPRPEAYLNWAVQTQFNEANNNDFFGNWKVSQINVKWYNWQIEHLQHNSYLIGKRKTKDSYNRIR